MDTAPKDSASDRALAAEVEEAAVASAWRRPDSIIVQREGWMQVITPSSPVVSLNSVMQSVLHEAQADEAIERVIADYRARGLPFRWVVMPSSRPDDLATRLVAHGLVLGAELLGMAADVDAVDAHPEPDVMLEDLRLETLDDWVDANATGWGTSGADAVASLHADVERQLRDDHDRFAMCSLVAAGRPRAQAPSDSSAAAAISSGPAWRPASAVAGCTARSWHDG